MERGQHPRAHPANAEEEKGNPGGLAERRRLARASFLPIGLLLAWVVFGGTPRIVHAGASAASDVRTAETGRGAGGGLDLVAERAYLRTGQNSGAEVSAPAVGQRVFFHFDWRVDGSGALVDATFRAILDSQVYCSGSVAVTGGNTVTSFCNAGWNAVAGAHQVSWELDYTQTVAETNGANNSAAHSFSVGAVPTVTRTPTRTRTATHTRTATSPPRSPVGTPTATATRLVVPGESFFARGDADCSRTLRAADVIATLRGLAGEGSCNNDDCDRDGAVTAGDAACAATCLFGRCAVPPNAPRVTGVAPDSAPDIGPGSVITVAGDNLGSATSVKRAVVGGVEAEIVDFDGESLTIVVPFLDPGPTTMVIYDGEIASLPMTLNLSVPQPVGEPDTLVDLLDLLDAAAARLAAIDLSLIYEEEEIGLVLDVLADFRAARAALPEAQLSPEQIAQLDLLADASGIPEQLRGLLADLEAFERGQGGAAGATVIVSSWRGVIYRGIRWLGTGGGTAGIILRTSFSPLIAKGVIAGVVVVGAVKVGAEIARPGAFEARFFAADGVELVSGFATAGGTVRIRMSTLFPSTIGLDLLLTTAFGQQELAAFSCGINCRDFRIPNEHGICGAAQIQLTRGPLLGNTSQAVKIRPVLIDAGPPSVGFGEPIDLLATGFAPCEPEITFLGPLDAQTRLRVSRLIDPDPSDHNRLMTAAVLDVDGRLRELPPGVHEVGIRVQGVAAEETDPVRIRTRVQGLAFDCEATTLALPDSPPGPGTICRAKPVPDTVDLFPVDTLLDLESSDAGIVEPPSRIDFADAPFAVAANGGLGSAKISGQARSSGVDVAMGEVTLSVDDRQPPAILIGDTFSMPGRLNGCGTDRLDPEKLNPGGSLSFEVQATDNHSVLRIRVRAPEESLSPADIDFLCPVEGSGVSRVCAQKWNFNVLGDAAAGPVELRVEARDLSGNESEEICRYEIKRVELTGFVFTLVEVHELTITSCFIPDGEVTVTERFDRRGNVSEADDPLGVIARDNLLGFANRKKAVQGDGWIRDPGRDCPIFTSVLAVTVTQVDGLELAEAQQRLRDAPDTETFQVQVQGCEIRGDCS